MITPSRDPRAAGLAGSDAPATLATVLWHRALDDEDGEVVRRSGGAPWTAGELWRAAASLAVRLGSHVDVGDVVVTASDTGPESLIVSAAVSALGAVELPVHAAMPPEWMAGLVSRTGAVAIVATPDRAIPLAQELATATRLPMTVVDASRESPAEDLLPIQLPSTAAALIMTTSGTTGRTKAALLPVGAPIGQARRVSRAMAYGPDDVLLSNFAWHHINARNACFLPALISGARIVVAPRFSASQFFDLARAEEVTAFNFMGAMCGMLLAQPPSERDRGHRIRVAYGGPAPADLVVRFRERFGVTLRQAYACTELGDVAITSTDQLRPGAAGRVVDDYEVRVVNDDLEPVPDGEPGELIVRPRRDGLAFHEYVGDEQATASAWQDGWFRTRDRARVEDGWLWIDGRLGDVIRRRGVNLDPQHIEDVLVAHPDVVHAAAVAVPSPLTDDEVLVVAVPAEDSTLDASALWDHCRDRLPRHMVPRFLSLEPELPLNANLKVNRAQLRSRGLPAGAWDADLHHPRPSEAR